MYEKVSWYCTDILTIETDTTITKVILKITSEDFSPVQSCGRRTYKGNKVIFKVD